MKTTFDEKVQVAVQEFEIQIQRAVQEEVGHRLNTAFEMAHRERERVETKLGDLFDTNDTAAEENGQNGHNSEMSEPSLVERSAKTSGRKIRKGGASEQSIEKVAAFVKSHPGLRSEEIQKTSGMNSNQVRKGLDRLREEGRVRTQGQKRATTYTLLA